MVKAGFIGVLGDPEAAGTVALRIGVNDEDANIIRGKRGGEIDGGCGLPDPAFLVGNCEDSAQGVMVACCFT